MDRWLDIETKGAMPLIQCQIRDFLTSGFCTQSCLVGRCFLVGICVAPVFFANSIRDDFDTLLVNLSVERVGIVKPADYTCQSLGSFSVHALP